MNIITIILSLSDLQLSSVIGQRPVTLFNSHNAPLICSSLLVSFCYSFYPDNFCLWTDSGEQRRLHEDTSGPNMLIYMIIQFSMK